MIKVRRKSSLLISLGFMIIFALCWISVIDASCQFLNYCSGHGKCRSDSKCACYRGWGSDDDLSIDKAADCSKRVCPSGTAWGDLAQANTTAAHENAECSNAGICDRKTGQCKCFSGFTGRSCDRRTCPNDCSGHGRCKSMSRISVDPYATPTTTNDLRNASFYGYNTDGVNATWDSEYIYGCVCDSSWRIGVEAGERQVPEWFGADCSMRHCPSNDNPLTTTINELNCTDVVVPYSGNNRVGKQGNLCQVDCANLGICDYNTGTCQCFKGFYGPDCTMFEGRVYEKEVEVEKTEDDDYVYLFL